MPETWTVRIDGSVRPLIEAIAREEEREPAQVVRRLLKRALAQHPIRDAAAVSDAMLRPAQRVRSSV
jgi:hypothetical protein